jgi:hypothetical protein
MPAIALVDPYWLLGRASEPSSTLIHALQRAIGPATTLDRIYWYLETDGTPHALPTLPRVTLRVTARDDLDDGYELVRAMEGDLRAAATSRAYDTILIASHDDRLALTLEWVQAHGITVIACATTAEEPDPRIQRIVDEVIEPRLSTLSREEDDAPPSATALEVIESSIAQWTTEADADEHDRTRDYVEKRPGLPRPVDSRLLFLARTALGRELTQGERVTLRRRFRETLLAPVPAHL